jgi:polyhydroxyalkanoate synthase
MVPLQGETGRDGKTIGGEVYAIESAAGKGQRLRSQGSGHVDVVLSESSGTADQWWRVTSLDSPNEYRIENVQHNAALDSFFGFRDDANRVITYPWHGNRNQRWQSTTLQAEAPGKTAQTNVSGPDKTSKPDQHKTTNAGQDKTAKTGAVNGDSAASGHRRTDGSRRPPQLEAIPRTVTSALVRPVWDGWTRVRRGWGGTLDAMGFGADQTPSEIVDRDERTQLRHYPGHTDSTPPVLLVPAPINRAYIWDLEHDRSVVGLLARSGFDVHLLEWTDPGAENHNAGLNDHVDRRVGRAVEAVRSNTGQLPVLIGHSLGGTLAALFSALHPDRLRGLALLEAPLHFADDAGAFASTLAAAPHARAVRAEFGNIPGSFLSAVSSIADPVTFQLDRTVDLCTSLWQRSSQTHSFQTHMRVERWALDELAMPGQLFEDLIEKLYREDSFMRGDLALDGHRVGPHDVTSPLLTVFSPASRVVPAPSALRFHDAAASTEKTLVEYRGDDGVALQHVGVLVGDNAHAQVWPEVVRWARQLPKGTGAHRQPRRAKRT